MSRLLKAASGPVSDARTLLAGETDHDTAYDGQLDSLPDGFDAIRKRADDKAYEPDSRLPDEARSL